MEKEIRTPYGPARETALEELQSSFDTRQLLAEVDRADRFCAQWREELRDDLPALHAMAHTVINGAPLTVRPGKETLAATAASLNMAFSEAAQELLALARVLDPIASASSLVPAIDPVKSPFTSTWQKRRLLPRAFAEASC